MSLNGVYQPLQILSVPPTRLPPNKKFCSGGTTPWGKAEVCKLTKRGTMCRLKG